MEGLFVGNYNIVQLVFNFEQIFIHKESYFSSHILPDRKVLIVVLSISWDIFRSQLKYT